MPSCRGAAAFDPAHMLDQSHNVTDPIESLMLSATEVQAAYAAALLVDRKALDACQEANDALMASETLKTAFRTDVEPILAQRGCDRAARSIRSRPIGQAATARKSRQYVRRSTQPAAGSCSRPLSLARRGKIRSGIAPQTSSRRDGLGNAAISI